MYKDFYVEYWNGKWSNTKLLTEGVEVEKEIKRCRENDLSVRVRRVDCKSEQLDVTYCYIASKDHKEIEIYHYTNATRQKESVSKSEITDEQAQEMLNVLTNHYRYPVMPVNKYCDALRTWASCIQDINEEAEAINGKGMSSRQGSDFWNKLNKILLSIDKSNLLWRLIYCGEELRTEKCPQHKGHWSGCSVEGCLYGCGETGWLPN